MSSVCDICEDKQALFYCSACDHGFCQACDTDYHKPKKLATHVRSRIGNPPSAEGKTGEGILSMVEELGKCENYGSSAPEGKNILKYELEYDGGFYYVYKNNSTDLQLEETLVLNELKNLVLEGELEGATRLKVVLPPGTTDSIHFKKPQPKAACHVGVQQFFSVTAGGQGRASSVKSVGGGTGDLKEQTEKEGEKDTYEEADERAVGISKWSLKHTGGYCFLYKNKSKQMTLVETLDFDMKNLRIEGGGADEKKVSVTLEPNEEKFVNLVTVDATQGFSMEVSSNARVRKSKKTWG